MTDAPEPGSHAETVGEVAHLWTAPHPKRSDSEIYIATRKWLMSQTSGGCFVCGGPIDLSHPEAPASAKGLQDHHGGGIHYKGVLVAMSLIPTEWSLGFAAKPSVVAGFVAMLNVILHELGEATFDAPITTTDEVMAWVDSRFNASIKLCAPHHVGTQNQHTPDARGFEAVGIHEIPVPIWSGQVTCDFEKFDMWSGTTGTVAVSKHPDLAPGEVQIEHVHESVTLLHPSGARLQRGDVLPASHGTARVAHAGYGVKA